MNIEAPLQAEMFSGQLVDNRTRNQRRADRERGVPTQQAMFPIHETVHIGAKVRPWLSDAPKPSLVLVSEDPRSEDEIELDLMREAEALTTPLFADTPQPSDNGESEHPDSDNETALEQPDAPVATETPAKHSIYHSLVTLVREQALTVWVDSAYRQRYYNQLPLTIQAAQGAGLTASEISAAMQIGEFLGSQEREAAGRSSDVDISRAKRSQGEVANDKSATHSPPLSPQPAIEAIEPREGLRMTLRRDSLQVRTRQPKATATESVPALWMEREHIQKRLPYLAEGIARLDEDELASMAESISEVLQETYWTILGITLAHYLDDEQKGEGSELLQLRQVRGSQV